MRFHFHVTQKHFRPLCCWATTPGGFLDECFRCVTVLMSLGLPAAHRMHLDATPVLAVDLVVDGADAGRAADRDVVRPRLHQALHLRGQRRNARDKSHSTHSTVSDSCIFHRLLSYICTALCHAYLLHFSFFVLSHFRIN